MVELTRDDDPLGYRTTAGRSWPEGTAECAADLDRLGLPVDIGVNAAAAALRDGGVGRRKAVVAAAVKYRSAGTTPGTTPIQRAGTTSGTTSQEARNSGREPLREPPGTTHHAHPEPPVHPIGGTGGGGRGLVDYQRPKKGDLLGPVPGDPWAPGQALADDDCRDYPNDLGEPVSAGLLHPLV